MCVQQSDRNHSARHEAEGPERVIIITADFSSKHGLFRIQHKIVVGNSSVGDSRNAMHLLVWRCQCIVDHPKTISGQRTHTHTARALTRHAVCHPENERDREKGTRPMRSYNFYNYKTVCERLCAFWPDVATQCDAGVRRVKPSRAQHSPPPPAARPRTSLPCVYFWSRRTRAKCAHCLQLQLLQHARIAHTRNA